MKLVIVVNNFPVISETFIFNKVMGLREAGLDVTVFAQSENNHLNYYRDRFGEHNFNFVVFNPFTDTKRGKVLFRLVTYWLRNPQTALYLWKKATALYGRTLQAFKAWVHAYPLKLGAYDIIHFEYSGLAVEYLDALPLLEPAKLLTSCRGTAEQIIPYSNSKRAEQLRWLFPLLHRVHCVSYDMQKTVTKYGLQPDNSFVNPPSINVAQFRRSNPYASSHEGPVKLLTVGRLHWKKGLDFGLLAVKKLVDDGISVHYDIVGGGPEDEKLHYLLHDLGLVSHTQLWGPQSSGFVRQMMETADIFWLPSLSEGLSNAALEAMAMELPIVSTTAGGMSEAILDQQEGFLVPPYDAYALAEKTKILIGDGALRLRMGQAARRRVETQFNLEGQIERFIQEYRSLAESPC